MNITNMREYAQEWLKKNGFDVVDISAGSGIPKLSRLEIKDESGKYTCAVRLSLKEAGRISFPNNEDGTWDPISSFDRLLYLQIDPKNPSVIRVILLKASDVVEAFQATYEALLAEGNEGYQVWLSPVLKEEGTRFLRSGFADKAIIDQSIELKEGFSNVEAPPTIDTETNEHTVKGIIKDAKNRIAALLEIDPVSVEIDVNISIN